MKSKITFLLLFALPFLFPLSSGAVYNEGSSILNKPQFVPNQVVVKYKVSSDPKTLKQQSSNFSISAIDRVDALQDYNQVKQFNQSLGVTNTDVAAPFMNNTYLYITDGAKSVYEIVSIYNGRPEIEYAEPNHLYYPMKTPNDQLYGRMWGLAKINMPSAWDKSTGSRSVKAAVIDSGADVNHPDLKNNIVETKAFCGRFAIGDHATHTNGTVGAVGNNAVGVTGINWEISLMSLDVFCGGGGATMAAIASAISYAATNGAKVINMSLGSYVYSPTLQSEIAKAVNNGATIVVAAGNERQQGKTADQGYPARDPNVITVAATKNNDQIAPFSNPGNAVDVAAPGVGIASTVPGGQYQMMSGTSMASPHVAGLVGLIYALNPSIRPSEVKSILESTAVDLGIPGRDRDFGAGRIDAAAALARVGGGGGQPTPTQSVNPTNTVTQSPQATLTPPKPTTPGGPTPTSGSIVNPTPPDSQCNIGDFNCDGKTDKQDFEDWKTAFLAGNATLKQYDEWRRVVFSRPSN